MPLYRATLYQATLYRATLMHTPRSPFAGGELEVQEDGGLLVENGRIRAHGPFQEVQAQFPQAETVRLQGGALLPGLVDTHVHYPQIRVLGGLGMTLLEWLERNTLPEEARLADPEYARAVAREFLSALAAHGTTTALVFGAHFARAMEVFFEEAARSGLRVVAGQVLSDRLLRPELHITPERAYEESTALINRFHGRGRLRYAVTPRFSLSASEGMLDVCGALLSEHAGLHFTSHINEQEAEIRVVRGLFPWARDYLDTYERSGLLGPHSVLAHNVYPSDRELAQFASTRSSVSHCPCSNASLGSGFFPLRRHLAAGVHFSLGTDVGGGTGFSLLKEGLQAYFLQRLAPDGYDLTPAHLLYLATLAGAQALGLGEETGSFTPGKAFDAVWLRPRAGTPLEVLARHAGSAERLLAGLFTLGGAGEVARVWVAGQEVGKGLSA